MRPPGSIRSYKLVPQGNGSAPGAPAPGIRRYGLARVGVARRSALGEDRHERMEGMAGMGAVPSGPMRAGLCDSCRHQRIVRSGRGSVFSLCERHTAEPERYPKYPRLPVESCPGYDEKRAS